MGVIATLKNFKKRMNGFWLSFVPKMSLKHNWKQIFIFRFFTEFALFEHSLLVCKKAKRMRTHCKCRSQFSKILAKRGLGSSYQLGENWRFLVPISIPSEGCLPNQSWPVKVIHLSWAIPVSFWPFSRNLDFSFSRTRTIKQKCLSLIVLISFR